MFVTDVQVQNRPTVLNALFVSIKVEYCYNDRRDLVKVIPVPDYKIQLPQSEQAIGLPPGGIGVITVTREDSSSLRRINLGDRPIKTVADQFGEGETYFGTYTVNLNYKPRFEPLQTYAVKLTLLIDSFGASEFAPELRRFS